ncbi:MAG: hypothetical protein QNL70_11605, partial [Pseudomonas sp.]
MSNPADSLLLQRQPSRWLGGLLIIMTMLGCMALYRSALPALPASLCVLLLLMYCFWIWPRQVSLRHARSVTALRFDSQGWHVLRRDGTEIG